MTKDEALKLALEHFETWSHEDSIFAGEFDKEITAIKEALAQPEHGWTPERIAGIARLKDVQDKKLAQRTWAGLTDEERAEIKKQANYNWETTAGEYASKVQALTESKLKEKNNG